MKSRTMARHLREGFRNIIRNGWMTFASISSITISLFILGLFLLLSLNVNYVADQIEKQVEIRVYMDLNITEDQTNQLKQELNALSDVQKVTFVSKEQGLEDLRNRLGEEGKGFLEGFEGDENPLPPAFKVEVKDPRQVAGVADKINKLNEGKEPKPIGSVKYGQGTVENMFKITQIVRNVGLVLVALLAFTSVFLIANTIKLTIVARRREISIMKLVGATNAFIRWPFFIEGALLGIGGSAIPVVVLLYGYNKLVESSKSDLSMVFIKLKPFAEVSYVIAGLLLCLGFLIGIWGSIISVRKFLKV
ncbi:permease-like cell division protein FtsX [Paenibacillus chitinolyticus]|uniref:permease-like cell division protein FtsX n=1 Tax=Paenibacillus chitinolyticus TaxID=79263 RepID=UPI002DBE3436|nr:permease-like cell division protein FtsX [Paenibacillus chitinolyticus]MEC0244693.1 permease-like cell division protein FtsX [Paenibacillus chitinolyticus]